MGAVVILQYDSKNEDGTIKPLFEQFTSEIINKEKTYEKAKNETLQQIKDRIYLNRNELLVEFFKNDKDASGVVSVTDWCSILTDVLKLKIEWKLICPYLTTIKDDKISYNNFLNRYKIEVNE